MVRSCSKVREEGGEVEEGGGREPDELARDEAGAEPRLDPLLVFPYLRQWIKPDEYFACRQNLLPTFLLICKSFDISSGRDYESEMEALARFDGSRWRQKSPTRRPGPR
jgi:hypothetical protein